MRRGASELREGWPLVLASAVGMGFGVLLFAYVFGLLIEPLEDEFGWSRTQLAATILLIPATTAAMPLVGRLIDRVGVRVVVLPSLILLAIAYAIFALTVRSLPTLYVGFGGILLAGMATGAIGYSRVIANHFDVARGTALAAALAGPAIAAMVAPPALQSLIEAAGWRAALWALACLATVVALPCAFFALPRSDKRHVGTPFLDGGAAPQRLNIRRLSILCVAVFLTGLPVFGLTFHLKPMMTARGFSGAEGALFLSVVGLAVLVGRLITGILIDRFWAPGIASSVVGVAAGGAILLAFSEGSTVLTLFGILLMGAAQGAELDLIAYLTSRYFGLTRFGAVYGTIYFAFTLGLPTGAIFFSWAFENRGDYRFALLAGSLSFVVAAMSFLGLGRYPHHLRD